MATMSTESVKTEDDLQLSWQYHNLSKHSKHRSADGPRGLDWANQPNPFRVFFGSPRSPLRRNLMTTTELDVIYHGLSTSTTADLPAISQLLFYSMSLSAWKSSHGNSWSLRVNPSSGNLHPTECYAILPPIRGICGSDQLNVHHYMPHSHSLELRGGVAQIKDKDVANFYAAGGIILGLTSIYWRESWKYGVRAYRYCQHDIGHAIAAVSFSAALLGWKAAMLWNVSDDEIFSLLGLSSGSGSNKESPDLLLAVYPINANVESAVVPNLSLDSVVAECTMRPELPNEISSAYTKWTAIDIVSQANSRNLPKPPIAFVHSTTDVPRSPRAGDVFKIIRQRRSAQAFRPRPNLPSDHFFRILISTMYSRRRAPFSTLPCSPRIDLLLFVHSVMQVSSGLYVLIRTADGKERLKAALAEEFEWTLVPLEGAPQSLYMLKLGNFSELAKSLSCSQNIARDGAFAVAMLADFQSALTEEGSWFYRVLHWEAGMIGQVLYLEAEMAGMQGTGIGCFLDDPTLECVGFTSKVPHVQDIYHFTVGHAVHDARVQTFDAYAHLDGRLKSPELPHDDL